MEQRLVILRQAELINEEIYQGMLKVIARLESHWQLPIRNSTGEMVLTHMANALMRCHNAEFINGLDEDIFFELSTSSGFEQVVAMNQDLLSYFAVTVPDSENGYFLANLHALQLLHQETR